MIYGLNTSLKLKKKSRVPENQWFHQNNPFYMAKEETYEQNLNY